MQKFILNTLLILSPLVGYNQVSLENIKLDYGNFKVGFKNVVLYDSSRTYSRTSDWTNSHIPRPISTSIWYPSVASSGEQMTVLDYMRILKEEEEWEHLPDEQILNWFNYPNTEDNQAHIKEVVLARKEVNPANGEFPILIYAPGYNYSSIENFALCELLASHGYVVIASPSKGADSRWMQVGNLKDIETQARDMEFLMAYAKSLAFVDKDRIASVAYSFGGMAQVLSQSRNGDIDAMVSLDGSIKYQYYKLLPSPFYAVERVDVPFLHMAQKDIPMEVMIKDGIDTTLNNRFQFFDSLKFSDAYSLKFKNLSHAYFTTLGVLFQPRDARQDKSDQEIMEGYRWSSVYTLSFLEAFLMGETSALSFWDSPIKNDETPGHLASVKWKKSKQEVFDFKDFHEMAIANDYKDLKLLYQQVKQKHPAFQIKEGDLNSLGLHLVYDQARGQYGIEIFLLAVHLYPQSGNLFDSLAEGYLHLGDKQHAAQYFKKSLELSPYNTNAKNRLKELGASE